MNKVLTRNRLKTEAMMTGLLSAENPNWLTLPEPLTLLGNWAVIVLGAVGVCSVGYMPWTSIRERR